jgi:hypothetical protein
MERFFDVPLTTSPSCVCDPACVRAATTNPMFAVSSSDSSLYIVDPGQGFSVPTVGLVGGGGGSQRVQRVAVRVSWATVAGWLAPQPTASDW